MGAFLRLSPRARVLLLLILYVALTALPLVLAKVQSLPPRPWRDELSSGLAMTAFAIFLLEFLLSGRYRAISAGVGMDVTMRFHQMMALVAAAFVLVHPLLYTLPYNAGEAWDATRQYTVTLGPAAAFSGIVAWLLVGIVVMLALLRSRLRYSYEAWRLSHGVGALSIAALGAHHALVTGRYTQADALRFVWWVALVLALLSLLNAYVVKPLRQRRQRLHVARVEPAAQRIWRVVLKPDTASSFRFVAGQFVWLKFHQALGRITEHPFSIASAPAALPQLAFLIKEGGDFTGTIGQLAAGTPVYVDGPYGNFTLRGRACDGVMLIAGGVGIAPVLSIASEFVAQRDTRPLTLLYADRTPAQLAAREELNELARLPNVEIQYLLAEPPADWKGLGGMPDEANLSACMPKQAADQWLYFVCGPPAMIDRVELALARLGVPLGRIVSERFRYETGIITPRERLVRAVIMAVLGAQLLAVLAFALI